MGRRNKARKPAPPEPEFETDPFAALSADNFPDSEPEPKPAPEPETKADTEPESAYPSIEGQDLVLQLERKGRRGKTVTVVQGLPLQAEEEVMCLAAELKRRLGTGGTVRDDCLELQGDQRRKTAEWLRHRGMRVRGNCG